MLPDLNRLLVFARVYANESMVGAARVLHVTQPAVSQSLKKLEQELGVALFVRMHKKLAPTREGAALYALVSPMLSQLEEGISSLHRGREVPCGELRLGAPVEFGQSVLPGWLATFRAAYPEVRFTLVLGHSRELLPQLREGALDMSFADIFAHQWELADELSLYHIEPLLEEELCLVGSASYCAQHLPAFTREALLGCSYIAYAAHAPSLQSWWRHHVAQEKTSFALALVAESVRAAMEAVRCGMGLAVLPKHMVVDPLASGMLETIPSPLGAASQRNHVSLVQLQDKVPTLTEKRFIGHCHEESTATFDATTSP